MTTTKQTDRRIADYPVRTWECVKCGETGERLDDFECDDIGFRYSKSQNLSYGTEGQGLTTDFNR